MYTEAMKLTKYAHACLVLEESGQKIVIDPGNFSDDFEVPDGILAVVVTHLHGDHCDPVKLRAIFGRNPGAKLYALREVAKVAGMAVSAVEPGQTITTGKFELEFTGGRHATIHPDMEPVGNIGIVVNHDLLYYPGDALALPSRHIRHIAVPVAAPWMRLSKAINFLRETAPEHAFPTHDAILSDKGQDLVDRVVRNLISADTRYQRISSGETIVL